MKKSRIISVVVITTIMVFAAGFYSGMHYDFPFTHWSTSSLKDNMAEANETLILLAQLDNNKMEAIYELSNLKLDGAVLAINSLMEVCDDTDLTTNAKHLLANIAKYRKDHPFKQKDKKSQQKISDILKSYLKHDSY